MSPSELPLKFKYRSDKNGVPSYGSRTNNNQKATRRKLTGKQLDRERAITSSSGNRRVLCLLSNGKLRFRAQ